MTYRISYDDGLAVAIGPQGGEGVKRTEYFHSELAALNRARQLIEDGEHHAVAVHDSSGSVLTGILLQLKLSAAIVD
jgi:hypothetical protein